MRKTCDASPGLGVEPGRDPHSGCRFRCEGARDHRLVAERQRLQAGSDMVRLVESDDDGRDSGRTSAHGRHFVRF